MNVQVGDEIPPWVMESVSAARMRTMAAILRDPNPVHWDRRVVSKIGYGDHTINQGPLGLSYMVNMLHDWAGVGCLCKLVMRFPMAVLDEDHITARGTVTSVWQEDGATYAACDVWLDRPGTDHPLEGSAVVKLPE